MDQKKSGKSGILNALKKRFWSRTITEKSCLKNKVTQLKLKTESSHHCNCVPSEDVSPSPSLNFLEIIFGNTCEETENVSTSTSGPVIIVNDIQDISGHSEMICNVASDSACGELSRQLSCGKRHGQDEIHVEQPQLHTSSPNCTPAGQMYLQSALNETNHVIENEDILETNTENQNQLHSNLKSGLLNELHKLSKCGWYWGSISKKEAEEKLTDQPDGAFLLRDSSADNFLLSLSFRSSGKTLHTRIIYSFSLGLFSFYQQPDETFISIAELIEHSMLSSQSAVYCYSRPRSPWHPAFPVRLIKPVSRFAQVRSLQHLCRFVIRESIRLDYIQKLPLPPSIKGYIEEGHYY